MDFWGGGGTPSNIYIWKEVKKRRGRFDWRGGRGKKTTTEGDRKVRNQMQCHLEGRGLRREKREFQTTLKKERAGSKL